MLLSLPKEHRFLYNYSCSPFSPPQTHSEVSGYLVYHEEKHWLFWQEILEGFRTVPYLMGMPLRVHVISGSGYDSTTQTNLATSSTRASTVSRGVLINGAVWTKRKWENFPVPARERHEACQTPLVKACMSLQGHSMAFSTPQWCFTRSLHICCSTSPSTFEAATFCCVLHVLHLPCALSIECKTEHGASPTSPVCPWFLALLSPKVHSTGWHTARTEVRLSPC